jgi:hypothetical protein
MANKWTLINNSTGQVHTFTTKRDMISFINTKAPGYDLRPDREKDKVYYIERPRSPMTRQDQF